MVKPLFREMPYRDPLTVFGQFSGTSGAIFLDSAQLRSGCGRYSFIAVDPFHTIQLQSGEGDPFRVLKIQLAQYPLDSHADLPPFQGGMAGYFSYDLCHYLEKLPLSQTDDMQFPVLAVGLYDLVMAFDHESQCAWIFSSGYPEQGEARTKRASERLEWLWSRVSHAQSLLPLSSSTTTTIQVNFTSHEYQAAVNQVIEYILAGDIFEANISQRFKAELPVSLTAFDLYRRLRVLNPAPFSAYVAIGDTVIASASPERFLKLANGRVETRPIKGTRPRGTTPQHDDHLRDDLIASEKDRAENIMIVDLLRNDLSRVCEDHSVQVTQLCGLESYATVHHLVSVVTGQLKPEYDAIDLFAASFPGGSITGAPKVRAMEIIAEIEPTARGPYCGSIGYIGFNGDMDASIVIRTFAIKNNIVTFQAGGAVVADSNPAQEYEEVLTKAKALLGALNDFAH